MKNFFDLIDDGYKVLTCGTNSIILVKNGSVFKVTREFLLANATSMLEQSEKLKELDVLTPQVKSVGEVGFASSAEFDLMLGEIMQLRQTQAEIVLNKFVKSENTNNYVVPMIEYEYICGKELFSQKHMAGIDIINRNKCFRDAKKLHPVVFENLMKDLEPNLQALEQIEERELYQFLKDGKTLLDSGFVVDNITGENFVYGVNNDGKKGFYFLDIQSADNQHKVTASEKNLFKFTVDNLCRMVYVDSCADLGNVKHRQAKCLQKIDRVVEQFLKKNPECKKQFEQYLSEKNCYLGLKDNLNKTLGQQERE